MLNRVLFSNENYSRRVFLKYSVMWGSTFFLFKGVPAAASVTESKKFISGFIGVDYNRCTGCRTCETICASFNHGTLIDGKPVKGLGNPYYSAIRVSHFNPDADVPVTCSMCTDTPCIKACPTASVTAAKKKALYRHPETKAIVCDRSRCVGCGKCAQACETSGTGILMLDVKNGFPERLCSLCGGDPQCVKGCPFDALSFQPLDPAKTRHGRLAETIARDLIKTWYGTNMKGEPI